MTEANPRKPIALIGCSDEWLCRSIESVFAEKGYDVTRTGSGKQALKMARRGGYDVLIFDEQLHELHGADVCLALRDDPLFDHATPIIIISSSHSTLPGRLKAYAAGAWEYCHLPLDVDGLFLKLGTFLRARQELAATQAKSLMDPASGLYTPFGLHQLAEQLEARALRNHEPFACVAFSPETADFEPRGRTDSDEPDSFADVVHVVREQARRVTNRDSGTGHRRCRRAASCRAAAARARCGIEERNGGRLISPASWLLRSLRYVGCKCGCNRAGATRQERAGACSAGRTPGNRRQLRRPAPLLID
jgi:DNA-binding response OmpR family regulator